MEYRRITGSNAEREPRKYYETDRSAAVPRIIMAAAEVLQNYFYLIKSDAGCRENYKATKCTALD